ncbi:MAG: hypothetical protein JRN42_07730 [Nitrososphaerota archaeon]|nr:hypothetical protein [Nitrososphaerota archaeon]
MADEDYRFLSDVQREWRETFLYWRRQVIEDLARRFGLPDRFFDFEPRAMIRGGRGGL